MDFCHCACWLHRYSSTSIKSQLKFKIRVATDSGISSEQSWAGPPQKRRSGGLCLMGQGGSQDVSAVKEEDLD
eukprot:1369374-Amphidinium_carterae.1